MTSFRSIFLVLAVILASVIAEAGASVVEGFVSKEAGGFVLIETETQKSFKLKVANEETQTALNKLNNFDFISGFGDFIAEDTVLVDSVDYVGLRRLLGLWKAPDGIVNFLDYSNVYIYLEKEKDSVRKMSFNYAVSPSQGDQWKIFLTDKKSVILGSLTFQKGKANFEVYDPKSGEIALRINLTKLQRN